MVTIAGSITLPVNDQGRTKSNVDHGQSSRTDDDAVQSVFKQTFKKGSGTDDRFESLCPQMSTPVYTGRRPRCQNGLIATVHEAYANEVPLALSPDHVWAAIAQAVSIHVNDNAEQLRDVFVAHKGQKVIEVLHDGLTFGNPNSPWHEVFPVFASKLREAIKVPGFATAMLGGFSTTGQVESIAHTLALMDSLKEYFEYSVMTSCGIPRIDLLGTAADWRQLRNAAASVLKTVKMEWWAGELLPVLDHFVALTAGTVDKQRTATFWERIYCIGGAGGSGVTPYCTGWILVLFPFTVSGTGFKRRKLSQYSFDDLMQKAFWDDKQRQGLAGYEGSGWDYSGMDYKKIPSGVSCVPFKWKELKTTMQTYEMTMCGGFLSAIGVGPNNTVTPVFGWAVAHGKPESNGKAPSRPTAYPVAAPVATPVPAPPRSTDCRHGLAMSTNSYGGYAAGWICDKCSGQFTPEIARWHCTHCTIDVCTSCRPISRPSPSGLPWQPTIMSKAVRPSPLRPGVYPGVGGLWE